MAFQLVLESKATTCAAIEFDIVVTGHCQSRTVGGEGMVGDGAVEEVVNFRRGHVVRIAIGGALYYRCRKEVEGRDGDWQLKRDGSATDEMTTIRYGGIFAQRCNSARVPSRPW
jgi:hypothetical protein